MIGSEPDVAGLPKAPKLLWALWQALCSSQLVLGLGALLFVCLVAIVAVPSLRPGGPLALDSATAYSAWQSLHPSLGWALRALMGIASLVCVVRLADALLPIWQMGARVTAVLQVSGDLAEEAAIWERVGAILARNGYRLALVSGGERGRRAMVVHPLGHRLAIASLYLGLLVLLVSSALLWRWGWVGVSPPLVLGAPVTLEQPFSLRVELQELAFLHESEPGLGLLRAIVGVSQPGQEGAHLMLRPRRVARYAGIGLSIARELPAARVAATDASGSPVELYPMVGSLPAALVQRVAFTSQEEHLLAVPEANLMARITYVGDADAGCCFQVQALDGRDGTLLGEAFVSSGAALAVGDTLLNVQAERAIILALWRLPGLWAVIMGALLAAVGAVAHRVTRPQRLAIGLVHAAELGGWVLSVGIAARRPPRQFDILVSLLQSELET